MTKERMELIANIRVDVIKSRISDKDYLKQDKICKWALYAKDMETLSILNDLELIDETTRKMYEKDIIGIVFDKN